MKCFVVLVVLMTEYLYRIEQNSSNVFLSLGYGLKNQKVCLK